jgi:cytoskeletal protein RodZ
MASFGENLRRERELRGITLQELSNITKIGVRHLEALEKNRFDRLPGGVFNRGFVRAVARCMKLDESYWVSEYVRAANDEPEILDRYTPELPSPRPASSRRGVWSFLALLIIFAAGAYLVHDARVRRAAEAAAVPASTVREQPVAATSLPADSRLESAGEPTPLPASVTPTPVAASPARSEAAADLRLQVDVVEEVWVSVVVDEETRYRGWMKPGQPRRFRGSLRIEVTTRNASAVVLTLNGETLPPLGNPGEEKTIVLTARDLKPTQR